MPQRQFRSLFPSARRIEADVDEEIRVHIEFRTAELIRQGLSPAGAREEALRKFGDLKRTRAVCVESDLRRERRMSRRDQLRELVQDLRLGVRQLARRPAFAAVAVLTLAVGIGANSAVFSAADHVLLRPLPYRDAERVVTLWETNRIQGEMKLEVTPGNFLDWQERSGSFEAMGLVEPSGFDLTGDSPPVSVPAWVASEGYLEALGVSPALGRLFEPEEYLRNGPFVVMISHRLWQGRFGADASIVGRTIELDGRAATVVGITPRSLEYPVAKDIWAPKAFRDGEVGDRWSNYMHAVARLKPGVTASEAQADLDRVAAALAAEYPESNAEAGVNVVPLDDQILSGIRPALLVLLGAVALVLLIACANVASLLLARGAERERELGVRAALGAGRSRLVRQLVTESATLAFVGGGLGLALAWAGVRGLRVLSPPELPRIDTIAIDGRVLVFAFVIMLFTALLFGLAPAIRFSRPDLLSALRGSGRSLTAGKGRIRLRGALVVSEIALALILLVGAGLLMRSFRGLLENDLGFASENRISLQMFTWDRNPTLEARLQRAQQIKEHLEATPGVEAVEIVTSLPFHPSRIDAWSPLRVEGRPPPPPGRDENVYTTVASQGYFELMGVPLTAGRAFAREDRLDAPLVAIINEALRRRIFGGEDPIGQHVTVGVLARPLTREIVGVVGDVRPTALDSDPQSELFIPFAQSGTGSLTFVVRTASDPAAFIPTLQDRVWDVDPGQAIYHAATLESMISATLIGRRFNLVLFGTFSAVALILATIGIYGLISFSTSQRTGEIGVRMALGARRGDVITMIVRQAVWLALPGIALGVAGALALTRLMESMLYGVAPTDPATFAQVALLMLAVSAAAAFVPARRAAAADPVEALRDV